MTLSISKLFRRIAPVVALGALLLSMDGTWATAQPVTTPAASRAMPAAGSASARGAAPGGALASASSASGAKASGAPAAAAADPADDRGRSTKPGRKQVTGKLNLNTATEEQLLLLPSVGPSKAERIVVWRKKNGGFKRVADLRRVKGFGYKTFKRLEPFLDVAGETTLAARR